MKTQFFVYGMSYVLNRGSLLLILPFATRLFSLSELGLFELAQVTTQISLVLIGLNGGDVVVREGSADQARGRILFQSFYLWTLGLGGVVSVSSYFLIDNIWLKYGLMIGSVEALLSLYFYKFRGEGRHFQFLFLSIAKSAALLLCFAYAWSNSLSLEFVLNGQLILGALLVLAFLAPNFVWPLQIVSLRPYLSYSLILIPSMLSFWILSSSDKLMIQWFLGTAQVGAYHIVYSLGMAAMLINGALALTLPPLVFQNRKRFLKPASRIRVLLPLSLGLVALFALLSLGVALDKSHFHLIAYYPENTFSLLSWIFAGLYSLSFFYFYYSFLLLHKKTKSLMVISLVAALTNIGLNAVLLPTIGILGAAISTFVAYILFLALSAGTTQKWEPELRPRPLELTLLITGILAIFIIASVAQRFS